MQFTYGTFVKCEAHMSKPIELDIQCPFNINLLMILEFPLQQIDNELTSPKVYRK